MARVTFNGHQTLSEMKQSPLYFTFLLFIISGLHYCIIYADECHNHDTTHSHSTATLTTPSSIGSAWAIIQQSIAEMDAQLVSGNLPAIHESEESLSRALTMMQNVSNTEEADDAKRLDSSLKQALSIGAALHAAADAGDKTQTAAELKKLKAALELVEIQYPAEILKQAPLPQASTITAQVTIDRPLNVGETVNAIIRLTKSDGSPVKENDLIEAHTEKLHLLIIDKSLTDYHHEHPTPTNTPGEYAFSFTPRSPGSYRVWADIIPTATQRQQYVITDIPASTQGNPITNRNSSLINTTNGLAYTLTFDTPELIAGKPSLGTLSITTSDGKPFNQLEPIMGAYAHIVGFSENYQSIAHIHPMGPEPTKPTDRGQGILKFHIEPESPGLLRLFAQVQINGKSVFIPFTLVVKK